MSQNDNYTGSLPELLKLSFPLMLSWISTTIMMFVDRLFLSHFSLEALGAAVNAGTIGWGIAYSIQILAEMSQVVVAQYRGAQQNEKLSYPIWQMLWLVLFSCLLFLPIAIVGSKLFFVAGSMQSSYFLWFVVFGPAFGLIGAGSAYFIGRGESYIVTIAAVSGNLINLLLDYFMIFGIKGVLFPMGVKGAAIATGIGMSVQGLGLVFLFLKRTNFKIIPLSFRELKPCLRVGVSPAIFMTAELVGWGMFFSLMAKAGNIHLTITSICHSLIPLLACVGVGLQKAVSTMSGNMIGAKRMDLIPKVIRNALLVLGVYMLGIGLILYVFPDLIMFLFQSKRLDAELTELLRIGFVLSTMYLFFGGIRSIITGVLSAAGDSWFLTTVGSSSVWVFLLVPIYYFVLLNSGTVTLAQTILVLYGVTISIIYTLRYKLGNWSKNAIVI